MPYQKLGAGCFMAKTDIKSAFRIIPVHPKDHTILGMKWANQYCFDRALAWDVIPAVRFSKLSVQLLSGYQPICLMPQVLSTFWMTIFIISPTKDKCQSDIDNFLRMCSYLGAPIAQEKTVGPYTTLQFAGITLDSVRQEARLPEDKLRKCQLLLHHFYTRHKVTLRELQSLLGLLYFTYSVAVPGHAFLCRMIDLTKGI